MPPPWSLQTKVYWIKKKIKNLEFLSYGKGKKGKESKQCVGEGNFINVFEFQIDDMAH